MSLLAALQNSLARAAHGPITVAYSGGLDSTVLLHALAHTPPARARGLRAIHVDHGLHAHSSEWAEHCASLTQDLGIALEIQRVVVEQGSGTGLEDAARSARFNAFEHCLGPGEILALAHHRDDQAETILLKLLRGAGPEGLGGMRTWRRFARGWLWRPLLDVPRSAVHAYADEHSLRWIEDPSNTDLQLRRNFLRSEIMPRLMQRWPDAPAALAHSATWARAAADYIGAEARSALARVQALDPTTLRWSEWLDLPDALRDPVLRLWLRELGLNEPTHFHIIELERQLRAAEDRAPCLRFAQTELRRYRDLLYAMRTLPTPPEHWQTAWTGAALDLPGGGRLTVAYNNDASREMMLRVSYRRGGERLNLSGSPHARELRTLLQEAGIPPWLRERIPLIYAGDDLLAVGDVFLTEAGRDWCDSRRARFLWEQEG